MEILSEYSLPPFLVNNFPQMYIFCFLHICVPIQSSDMRQSSLFSLSPCLGNQIWICDVSIDYSFEYGFMYSTWYDVYVKFIWFALCKIYLVQIRIWLKRSTISKLCLGYLSIRWNYFKFGIRYLHKDFNMHLILRSVSLNGDHLESQ